MIKETLTPLNPNIATGLTDWNTNYWVQPFNAYIFQEALSQIETIKVKTDAAHNIYMVDDLNVAYNWIGARDINAWASFGAANPTKNSVFHAFAPMPVKLKYGHDQFLEESEARHIQMGIAQACKSKAINAVNAYEFAKAFNDMTVALNMPKRETFQDYKMLTDPKNTTENFYELKKAAKFHKTVTLDMANSLNQGMIRTFGNSGQWVHFVTGDGGFLNQITYKNAEQQYGVARDRQTRAHLLIERLLSDVELGPTSALLYDHSVSSVSPVDFEAYCRYVGITHALKNPERQLYEMYSTYAAKHTSFAPIALRGNLAAALNAGVRAYLRSSADIPIAKMMHESLASVGVNDLNPIMIMGALTLERFNQNQQTAKKFGRPIPGLDPSHIPEYFKAIRDVIYTVQGKLESRPTERLGSVLIEHFRQAGF